jgi:hypothetical protein
VSHAVSSATNYHDGQLPWDDDFAPKEAASTIEHAFSGWQDFDQDHAISPPNYTLPGHLFLPGSLTNSNSYPIGESFLAYDPAIFDKPFNGSFLCNVLGCLSTFTRKADRDRHVQSWHNFATLHLCPVLGCEKSFGKPYSRKDKLQEHMRKKHAGLAQARAEG